MDFTKIINSINIFIKIFSYLKRKRTRKTFFIFLLSTLFATTSSVVINLNLQKNGVRLHTIDTEQRYKKIEVKIDQILKQLGEYSFISWIMLEKKNDEFILDFETVKGIVPNGDRILDITDFNPLYTATVYDDVTSICVDRNSRFLLETTKEFEIVDITREDCINNGYTTVYFILNCTNLKLEKIKFVVVKKEDELIWIFTLYSKNANIDDKTMNNMLVGLSRSAKKEILGMNND